MHSVPHSPVVKNILSLDCRSYLETRMCRSEPVGFTRTNGSTLYCENSQLMCEKRKNEAETPR